ncbi:MAG TPA: hypothetical protein PLP75_07285 [Burkholderiales bacterium]|nr:hypothetical protein [Burkholderiales bacterium]
MKSAQLLQILQMEFVQQVQNTISLFNNTTIAQSSAPSSRRR